MSSPTGDEARPLWYSARRVKTGAHRFFVENIFSASSNMAKKLRTTAVSSRKNVTLDLNNGCEKADQQQDPPPSSPPPPSPTVEQPIEEHAPWTAPGVKTESASVTDGNSEKVNVDKVPCDKCHKTVSSRCLRYYHVCKEDPVAKRKSKKTASTCEPVIEPVATTTMKTEEDQPLIARSPPRPLRPRCESSVEELPTKVSNASQGADDRLKNMKQYVEARRALRQSSISRQPSTIYDRLFE